MENLANSQTKNTAKAKGKIQFICWPVEFLMSFSWVWKC